MSNFAGKAGIFAGSLELAKEGNISIKQTNLFDDIFVKENKTHFESIGFNMAEHYEKLIQNFPIDIAYVVGEMELNKVFNLYSF